PLDALKLVKNATVEIELPLAPAKLFGGHVEVKPGTKMIAEVSVKDSWVDLKNAKIRFEPRIDGPLWTSIAGVYVDDTGRATVDIRGFFDPHFGPRLDPSLPKL